MRIVRKLIKKRNITLTKNKTYFAITVSILQVKGFESRENPANMKIQSDDQTHIKRSLEWVNALLLHDKLMTSLKIKYDLSQQFTKDGF